MKKNMLGNKKMCSRTLFYEIIFVKESINIEINNKLK